MNEIFFLGKDSLSRFLIGTQPIRKVTFPTGLPPATFYFSSVLVSKVFIVFHTPHRQLKK